MSDFETVYTLQELEGHGGYLVTVSLSIPLGYSLKISLLSFIDLNFIG